MIYLVTYATHTERYFEVLKKSNDLIVLGYGEEWKGYGQKSRKVVDFCKSKNPDDIICFVDGFDSVILTSKEEILEKYKSYQKPLVFSKDLSHNNILIKYLKDKFYNRCDQLHLNSGMYIGTASAIIELWNDIRDVDDDQTFATKMCNKNKNIAIDIENRLFYNYSQFDSVTVENKRLYVKNETPCIISAPANGNINHILKKLNYTNLPEIRNDSIRILKWFFVLIPEILFIILAMVILYYISDKRIGLTVCFILFLELIHYELFINHMEITPIFKIIYVFMDLLHISMFYFIFYTFINFKCNAKKLLLLNTGFLFTLLLFFIFKKCVFTVLENLVLGLESEYESISREARINYFFNNDSLYYPKKGNTMEQWMDGNKFFLSCILLLNVYCLWNMRRI